MRKKTEVLLTLKSRPRRKPNDNRNSNSRSTCGSNSMLGIKRMLGAARYKMRKNDSAKKRRRKQKNGRSKFKKSNKRKNKKTTINGRISLQSNNRVLKRWLRKKNFKDYEKCLIASAITLKYFTYNKCLDSESSSTRRP